jgi:hypothetical protein
MVSFAESNPRCLQCFGLRGSAVRSLSSAGRLHMTTNAPFSKERMSHRPHTVEKQTNAPLDSINVVTGKGDPGKCRPQEIQLKG